MRIIRYLAGYAAVAAAIPYFVLKIIWLTGGTVGFTAHTPTDGGFDALNAATFVMDAVAIAVALALTHRWGERVPAPVVLFPMWVGTGFLATILVGVPIGVTVAAAQGTSLFPADSIVQPWVYKTVYAGFIIQGAALLTAFYLYSKRRWPNARAEFSLSVLRLLGIVAAVMSFGTGLLYLYWAAGGTAGLPAQAIVTSAFYGHLMDGIFGLLSILGGVGLLRLTSSSGVTMAWLGSSANFAWGLWFSVNVLMDSPLTQGASDLGLLGLTNFTRVLAGVLAGLVAAIALSLTSDRLRG